jgi:hypothetical protein
VVAKSPPQHRMKKKEKVDEGEKDKETCMIGTLNVNQENLQRDVLCYSAEDARHQIENIIEIGAAINISVRPLGGFLLLQLWAHKAEPTCP